jgi:hypothetical protein
MWVSTLGALENGCYQRVTILLPTDRNALKQSEILPAVGLCIRFKQVSDFIFLFSGSNFAKEKWMGCQDSNLGMTESKSVVLPT